MGTKFRSLLLFLGIGFIAERDFQIYWTACTITSLGFFLPTAALPTYACEVLKKQCESSKTIMFVNIGTVIGTIVIGAMSDRVPVTCCIAACSIGTVLSLPLWGLTTNATTLLVFSWAYGMFAGSYVASWAKVMEAAVGGGTTLRRRKADGTRASWAIEDAASAACFKSEAERARLANKSSHEGEEAATVKENISRLWDKPRYCLQQKKLDCRSKYASHHDKMMAFGVLSLGRGLGNIFTGMLHDALLVKKSKAFGGLGSGYGPMIFVTAFTAAVGALPAFVWLCDQPSARLARLKKSQ